MGRPPKTPPTPVPNKLDLAKIEDAEQAAQQLGVLREQATQAAQAVAQQVGYDGTLAVGALEDEIRFYQRRTVEACLELGKRLLVLKELTPHGEFQSRLDLLGFTKMTAHRFMTAAMKTAKSTKLVLLSSQVKSMSAFLELVTHDEDVLEDISRLDDIDKMSASQVRAKCRDLVADKTATDEVLAKTRERLTELEVQTGKRKRSLPPPEPDQVAAEIVARAHESEATACAWIEGHFRQAIDDLLAHDEQHGTDHRSVLSGFITRIEDATDMLRVKYSLKRVTPDDPFAPLPKDFLERQGIVMPKPNNAP